MPILKEMEAKKIALEYKKTHVFIKVFLGYFLLKKGGHRIEWTRNLLLV